MFLISYFILLVFIIISLLLLHAFLYSVSTKNRKQAELAEAINSYKVRLDFFLGCFLFCYIIKLSQGIDKWLDFYVAIACCLYIPYRYYSIKKALRPKPLLTRAIKTNLTLEIKAFNRHKLVAAYIQLLNTKKRSTDDLESIINEMVNRKLWDSSRNDLEVFLFEYDIERSEVTLYISEKFIATEDWRSKRVFIHRTEDISEFYIKTYPSILISSVTLGFRAIDNIPERNDIVVFYSPFKGLTGTMQTLSKLGITIVDEREDNDPSKDLFKELGMFIPQISTKKTMVNKPHIDILIDNSD